MKKILFISFGAFVLIIVPFLSYSQQPFSETIEGLMSEYINSNPQEKIYAQFNQPYYVTGDHVGYKVYQVNSFTNQPESLSKTVYVSFQNNEGLEILNQKIRMKNGVGHGDFKLNDSLKTARYQVKFVTNWMRNFPSIAPHSKELLVFNLKDDSPEENAAIELKEPSELKFFTEGGKPIEGLPANVVFTSMKNGQGVPVKGVVVNDLGEEITPFATLSYDQPSVNEIGTGIGQFSFIPDPERIYWAAVPGQNDTHRFRLPVAKPNGLVLFANQADGFLTIEVRGSTKYEGQTYHLLCQSQGRVFEVFNDVLKPEKNLLRIPLDSLTQGLYQIILFDQDKNLQANRLIFIDKKERLKINLSLDRTNYGTRQKVTLKIRSDLEGQLQASHLAVRVLNENQFGLSNEYESISSSLLLSSELNGSSKLVPSASTLAGDAKTLDLFLITQLWRKFDWESILSQEKQNKVYRLEEGFSVYGRIKSSLNNEEKFDKEGVVLSCLGKESFFQNQFLYEKGLFTIPGFKFYGNRECNFQLISSKIDKEGFDLMMESITHETSNISQSSQIVWTPEMEDYIKKSKLRRQIDKNYQNPEGSKHPSRSSTDFTHFDADDIRILDEYKPFKNMQDIIREILPRVGMKKDKDGNKQIVIIDQKSFTHRRKPYFMIDGILFNDQQVLLDYDVDNIKSIEVIRSKEKIAPFGQYGWGGILAIYTHNKGFVPPRNSLSISTKVEGYHQPLDFNNEEFGDHQNPDFRPILYWNPDITTSETGKSIISFYTSDEIGDFRIDIEGISEAGLPGYASANFKVTRKQNQ